MRYRPCKGCGKRVVGCQEHCQDYKLYKEENEAVKKFLSPSEADRYIADTKRKRKM